MCILFIYNGTKDEQSDYSMILISNRDEYLDRRTRNMTIWSDDPLVVGGRDLEAPDGGTWLGVSPKYKKLGVLLNLPGVIKENAITRGKIVADYVKSNKPIKTYVESLKEYINDCNEFIFVSVDFSKSDLLISTYCNADDQLHTYNDNYLGFSNNLPHAPFKKVTVGREKLKDICSKFNKESLEKELLDNLIALLKSEERCLPDPRLEGRYPSTFEQLSSIYVSVPIGRYGTRTHTFVLLTKTGRLSITEITLQMPIDIKKPRWEKTEFTFDSEGNKI